MGTHKTSTWLALFALIANAASGVGLEQTRPVEGMGAQTVCDAQSLITGFVESTSTPGFDSLSGLQRTLGGVSDGEDADADLDSSPLFGALMPDRTPDSSLVALSHLSQYLTSTTALELHGAPQGLPNVEMEPGSPPTAQFLRVLRSPNAPPRHV
jgi:hypothetical protein